MDIRIKTFTPEGSVDVPSSKSIAHRFLIMGFLSPEEETINDVTFSEDIKATLNGLIALGANVEIKDNSVIFHKPNLLKEDAVIDANESGSTLRFLIPLASALYKHVKFTGKESLFRRPLSIYEDIFKKQNIRYEKTLSSVELFDSMKSDDFEVPGDISSQFITGLLFLNVVSKSGRTIRVIPPYESKEYVDITCDVISRFGFDVDKNNNTYQINSFWKDHKNINAVEKDFSQMAFWAVLGALKGNIEIPSMNMDSYQGDKQILDIICNAGCKCSSDENGTLRICATKLKPSEIDIASCIDLGPVLFTMAACTEGTTHITNIRRLRIKESDRVRAMEEELSKAGVKFVTEENDVYITGKTYYEGNYTFNSHNDHRIAMALSVFALINHGECIIQDAQCINKSYGSFYEDLKKLGGYDYVNQRI